jgi:LPXTG-motif cell wall-anchored protein
VKTLTFGYPGGKAVSHYSLSYVPVTKIDIPAQPTFEDPCGPDNANWNEQVDTDTLNWDVNDEGHLIVMIIAENVTFTDGTTTHDFGIAPDSGEECPVTEPQDTSYSTFCGGFTLINPEGNPELKFTYSDSSQGGTDSTSVTLAGGQESEPIEVDYTSAHVIVEGTGDTEYFDEYSVTIPQDCGEEPGLPNVTVKATCGEIVVTNGEDEQLNFSYFNSKDENDEGVTGILIEAGKSKTIKTNLTDVSWYAYYDASQRDHKGSVKVPQNCDTPPKTDKPKPPSGIGTPVSADRPLPDTGGSSLGLLALGGVLTAAGALVLRRRKSIA